MNLGITKHFLMAFVLALVLYLTAYGLIEHLRQRKGGWEVTFASDPAGQPQVTVLQPRLGISNVQFRFVGEKVPTTNLLRPVVFDRPLTNAPFGQILFIDTTFLPGTITFDFFGHEVQLLPRVLIVNKREVSWKSAGTIELRPPEKLPIEIRKQLRRVSEPPDLSGRSAPPAAEGASNSNQK